MKMRFPKPGPDRHIAILVTIAAIWLMTFCLVLIEKAAEVRLILPLVSLVFIVYAVYATYSIFTKPRK